MNDRRKSSHVNCCVRQYVLSESVNAILTFTFDVMWFHARSEKIQLELQVIFSTLHPCKATEMIKVSLTVLLFFETCIFQTRNVGECHLDCCKFRMNQAFLVAQWFLILMSRTAVVHVEYEAGW